MAFRYDDQDAIKLLKHARISVRALSKATSLAVCAILSPRKKLSAVRFAVL